MIYVNDFLVVMTMLMMNTDTYVRKVLYCTEQEKIYIYYE